MFLAIRLCTTDSFTSDETGKLVIAAYTEKVAVFTSDNDALEFAKDKGDIIIVDCAAGAIVHDLANFIMDAGDDVDSVKETAYLGIKPGGGTTKGN